MVSSHPLPPENLNVWILAGQSNMEGCGSLVNSLPPDDRVWCYYSGGYWDIAKDPLHVLHHSIAPVDLQLRRRDFPEDMTDDEVRAYYDEVCKGMGGGLGVSFGKMMADKTGRPVGLVAAAHGGTSLEEWSESRKDEGMHSLYGAMLERVKRAGGTLCGILWYQGESDCEQLGIAETYLERFNRWIEAARNDLGKPELPVVAVQIGCTTMLSLDSEQEKAWDTVRQALYNLPDTVPHTAVTSAIDLGLEDNVHIDTHGLNILGRRMARLALGLTGTTGHTANPRVESVESFEDSTPYALVRIVCSGVTGGWNPERRIAGFNVYDAQGQPIPDNRVYAAFRDPDNPSAIIVKLNRNPENGEYIGYGRGLNPYCNAIDDAEMPLCAFLRPITFPGN
jgi:sialate O-acetylesterase